MTTLYTIGYEGTDIGRFVSTLHVFGVELLIDVRAVPISRKKGFSKSALSLSMASEGIRYLHKVELGDPKSGRDAARAGRYDDFRQIYDDYLQTKPASHAIGDVARLAIEKVTCLMCFERDPLTCHRTLIGRRLTPHGLAMFHLVGDDPSRYERDLSKLPRRHPRESAAAA